MIRLEGAGWSWKAKTEPASTERSPRWPGLSKEKSEEMEQGQSMQHGDRDFPFEITFRRTGDIFIFECSNAHHELGTCADHVFQTKSLFLAIWFQPPF